MGAETEQMRVFITRGFAALQSAVTAAPQAQPPTADPRGVDPFTTHGSPWDPRTGPAEEVYVGTPVRPTGFDAGRPPHQRWAPYDGKYVLSGKGMYDKSSPQVWPQTIRNYFAGRAEAMDRVLEWVEKQRSEICRPSTARRTGRSLGSCGLSWAPWWTATPWSGASSQTLIVTTARGVAPCRRAH